MTTEIKFFEIRDRSTFVPAMATRINAGIRSQSDWLLRKAGFSIGQPYVFLTKLTDAEAEACYDPHDWGDRTFQTAHENIVSCWDTLEDGAVIDVEYILGETLQPKSSEREQSLLSLSGLIRPLEITKVLYDEHLETTKPTEEEG